MNPSITQDDIIYFVVTDRFFGAHKTTAAADNRIHGGTLDGILEKLDYLVELGITAIWVTPVYENVEGIPGAEPYHYYWPRRFDRIDPRLLDGTRLPQNPRPATFKQFVRRCQARGVKVILDMVVNHAGYGAKASFPAGWFNEGGSGDIEGELAGLPDFDHDNPEVVEFFLKNLQSWIVQGGVANIRMDTVKHVEPRFWHYFKTQIRGQYPHTWLVGEVLLEGKAEIPRLLEFQNYHDFDALFDFPLCTALRDTLIFDASLRTNLARPRLDPREEMGVLDDDNPLKGGYRNANGLVTLLDNHDLHRRILSHARTRHPGDGDGLAWALRTTKLCLGALFTIRGIPQLYYGTELGMEGWKEGDDRDLRRDFPWDAIGPDQHPLPERTREAEMYHWVRDLIRLRKANAAFRYGTTITLWSDDLVYAFLRVAADDVALVVINNGYADMPVPLRIDLNPSVLASSVVAQVAALTHWRTGDPIRVEGGQAVVGVPGKSLAVYSRVGV